MRVSLRNLLAGAAMATAAAAWAYNISGIVTDNAGEPLPDATVRLLQAKDSAFVKGAIADIDGAFRITGVNKGKYIVEATYIGYEKLNRPFAVTNSNVKLDTLKIAESSILLQEATVVGVKTPIKVMQDTVEFNADTYKTARNFSATTPKWRRKTCRSIWSTNFRWLIARAISPVLPALTTAKTRR